MLYFPLVGLIIGAILVLILYPLSFFLPKMVISVLLLLLSFLITGGMHTDGFVDFCDGFFTVGSREKKLDVMRDPTIGAMGMIGGVVLLLLKFTLLFNLSKDFFFRCIILMSVFSRWAQVLACYRSKYPRNEGKGKEFIGRVGDLEFIFGGAFTMMMFYLLAGVNGIVLFLTSFLFSFLFIVFIKKIFDGMTGDTIGASNEFGETSVLFFANILQSILIPFH